MKKKKDASKHHPRCNTVYPDDQATKLFHDFSWQEHKLRDRFKDLRGDHALLLGK